MGTDTQATRVTERANDLLAILKRQGWVFHWFDEYNQDEAILLLMLMQAMKGQLSAEYFLRGDGDTKQAGWVVYNPHMTEARWVSFPLTRADEKAVEAEGFCFVTMDASWVQTGRALYLKKRNL